VRVYSPRLLAYPLAERTTKEGGMLKEVYETYNELDSRRREAVVLKKR
jgi:hypothetical protein